MIDIQEICTLAKRAGAAIMEIYGSPFAVEMKEDRSPLTAADRASRRCWLDGSAESLPPFAGAHSWSINRLELGPRQKPVMTESSSVTKVILSSRIPSRSPWKYYRRRIMATAKHLTVPTGEDIRTEAVQTLIKRMGITKAAFFLRESMAQKTDYLKIKDEMFGKKTVDEVFEEIRKSKK